MGLRKSAQPSSSPLDLPAMNLRERPYLLFNCLAVSTFVISHIGFETIARLSVGQNSVGEAASKTLYYSATQPIGTFMLLAPFALLGWMAAALARNLRNFQAETKEAIRAYPKTHG